MPKYEALYIVDPKLNDQDVQGIANKYKAVIEEKKGTVEHAGKWEKRKLAYPVNGHTEGNYILMHFEADTSVPQHLSRLMRMNDEIIRHRVFIREK